MSWWGWSFLYLPKKKKQYGYYMIMWLASYPKSGNTFIRSLLSSYFFSEDGIFNFNLLKNIKQFPNVFLFN